MTAAAERYKAEILEPGERTQPGSREVSPPFQNKPVGRHEGYKRIFVCGHARGGHTPECARRVVGEIAHRACRRPVSKTEVDGLLNFVSLARQEGDGFEQGIQLALQA